MAIPLFLNRFRHALSACVRASCSIGCQMYEDIVSKYPLPEATGLRGRLEGLQMMSWTDFVNFSDTKS